MFRTSESSSTESTESSGTGSAEDTDTDTDTGSDFVPGGDILDGGDCDPFAQDCPEDEKCSAYDITGDDQFNANKCVPILGDGAAGDPCVFDGYVVATDDCDGQHFCYPVGLGDQDQLLGSCAPYCQDNGDFPSCPGMLACYLAHEGSINLCLPTCDPLAQDCADANATCQWGYDGTVSGGFDELFFCVQRGADVGLAQACSHINDCAAGSICLEAALVPDCADEACCTSYCEVGGMGGCDAQPGTSCEAFFLDPAPAGYELVGVCVGP